MRFGAKRRIEMRRGGFTLIELLVVIAIIGLLAGLVITAVGTSTVKANIAKVKAMIDNLETATALYYDDVGFYPPGGVENDEGNMNLVLALSDFTAAEGGKGGPNSPYLEFKESDLEPCESHPDVNVLVDPWGTPYRYIRARDRMGNLRRGLHRRRTYDMWSCGPDMKDDKGVNKLEEKKDDIANWH